MACLTLEKPLFVVRFALSADGSSHRITHSFRSLFGTWSCASFSSLFMGPREEDLIKSPSVELQSGSEMQNVDPVRSLDSVADLIPSSSSSTIIASPARAPVIIVAHSSSPTPSQADKQQGMSIGSGTLGNETASGSKHSFFGIDMPFDFFSAGFAALVATGGIIGYAKAGSVPSLVAGLTFGGLLGLGTYLTSVNPQNYYLTAGTSAVLAAFMGHRFYNSGKLMPAGLICFLSIGMVARYSMIAIMNTKQRTQ